MISSRLVAIVMKDSTVAVMQFATIFRGPHGIVKREATDQNVDAEIARCDFARNVATWHFITKADVPQSRDFRNAWRHDGQKFTVDMAHAREIHLARIRHVRAEALGQLDRDWNRAYGQGRTAEAQAIETRRQALRDLPTTLGIEKAQTPEALAAIWPEGLPRLRG